MSKLSNLRSRSGAVRPGWINSLGPLAAAGLLVWTPGAEAAPVQGSAPPAAAEVAVAREASAALPRGAGPLEATLKGSGGREARLSRWRGKPVILFYEDRDSLELNSRFKDSLFERGKAQGLLDAASVVAVANLQAYDFWPARGIALSFVRDAEKKAGIPILVDLDGTLARAPWALPPKTSNVVLLDAAGRPVFVHSGRLEDADAARFFAMLEELLFAERVRDGLLSRDAERARGGG